MAKTLSHPCAVVPPDPSYLVPSKALAIKANHNPAGGQKPVVQLKLLDVLKPRVCHSEGAAAIDLLLWQYCRETVSR